MTLIPASSREPIVPQTATTSLQSGRYYFVPNYPAGGVTATLGNTTLRVTSWYLPNTVTLSQIGAEINVVGDAGSKLRLGIYADDGTGRPGALVLDAGTIAGDSATVQQIAIAQLLNPGIYWVGGVVQLAPVTQPTVRANNSGPSLADGGNAPPVAAQNNFGFSIFGIVGALPNPFGAISVGIASTPRLFVKVQ